VVLDVQVLRRHAGHERAHDELVGRLADLDGHRPLAASRRREEPVGSDNAVFEQPIDSVAKGHEVTHEGIPALRGRHR